MGDRSCKRCSVTRVNTLCKAYEKAQGDNDPMAWHGLREVVTWLSLGVMKNPLSY